MAHRLCNLSPDSFCYVCGCYIGPKQVKDIICFGRKYCVAYKAYSGPIGDQDKSGAPRVICGCCRSSLEGWLRGSRKSMPFAVPRIWREPTNHSDNCYFCMVDISRYKKPSDKKSIVYPNWW